jgi:hypothetical protein
MSENGHPKIIAQGATRERRREGIKFASMCERALFGAPHLILTKDNFASS